MSLIISLLLKPQIIALDEPTNGLDFVMCQYLADKIKEIASRENITILLTTHDLHFVKEINAKPYILLDGKIAEIEINEQVWEALDKKRFKIEVSPDVYTRINQELLSECQVEKNETINLITSSAEVKDRIIKNYDVLSFQPVTMSLDEIYERLVKRK